MRFDELGLHDDILEAISYMGFETATPIQEQAIPEILNGKDLIACAQTGTGKTAAFILPILDMTAREHVDKITTVIIAPTRELAIQIDQQIQGLAYFVNVNSVAIYGGGDGDDWATQKKAILSGTNIIVGTPGRLIAHINMGYVDLSEVRHLILDEADRMLDMGFRDDISKIIGEMPKKRQNLMFSATMPPKIRSFTKQILNQPREISLELSKPAEGVLQAAYLVFDEQKAALIRQLIADKPNYKSILVFSSTKKKVSDIVKALRGEKYSIEWISSDLEQDEREAVLARFKSKRTRVLVATDVLSRGIDIKDIDLVINFDVPSNAEDYVHRVGRTARAETTGVAITLINGNDMSLFDQIETLIEKKVIKLPLPDNLGKGPEWNPTFRPKRGPGGGGRGRPGRGGPKGGGRGRR